MSWAGGLRAHTRIEGRVQGVYFRVRAVEQAQALGLSGWVRNRKDGTVELVAEGPVDAVEALLAWCAHGPDGARVDHIDVQRDVPVGLTGGFVLRPTA